MVTRAFSRNSNDLPFTLTYLFDETGKRGWHRPVALRWSTRWRQSRLRPDPTGHGRRSRCFFHPVAQLHSLARKQKLAPLPLGDWNKAAEQAAIVPLKQQGQERPAGLLCGGNKSISAIRYGIQRLPRLAHGPDCRRAWQCARLRGGTPACRSARGNRPRQDHRSSRT